uniref:Uncharacterized protein n=1 Tax=Anopheles stephensi TaxID=30069 RepID=A0A182YR96_ANOST
NVVPEVDAFTVDVSIDGLPLFKSSPKQLWPIQIRIVELLKHPAMIVGTFGGSKKPGSLEEFLRPLVEEINDLQRRGLKFGDKQISFSLRAFIADSPMRAALRAAMSFNAKHGCLKCTCVGSSIEVGPDSRKMIFDSINAEPQHQRHWPVAKIMLDEFVRQSAKYYGRSNLISNVYNIQHIAEEVFKLGPLDSFSAYEFENNLRFVKQCEKSGTKTIEQVAGRLIERGHIIKAYNGRVQSYPQLKA